MKGIELTDFWAQLKVRGKVKKVTAALTGSTSF